jgi:hypothetical protein
MHGFGVRLWRKIEPLQASGDLQLYGNPTAWWNATLSVAFLNHHFGQRTASDPKVLLLWDNFSGHWTDDRSSDRARCRPAQGPAQVHVRMPTSGHQLEQAPQGSHARSLDGLERRPSPPEWQARAPVTERVVPVAPLRIAVALPSTIRNGFKRTRIQIWGRMERR